MTILYTCQSVSHNYNCFDVLNVLDANPDWRKLNSAVQETPRLVKDDIFKGADSG